jgi:hypothetical protein
VEYTRTQTERHEDDSQTKEDRKKRRAGVSHPAMEFCACEVEVRFVSRIVSDLALHLSSERPHAKYRE